MSVTLVKDQIAKFLSRAEAEVLCIRGNWGVGKTFAWSAALEAAQKSGKVKLARYSYVSLFGINSLDELKFAIFENVITLSNGVVKPDLNTLDSFVSSKFGSWRKVARLAQSVPVVRNIIGGDATALVSFMTIRDQIVCIDDLERRGSKLDLRDVLGLISYLREQRGCKIILILNDQKLGEAAEAFGTNLEKVVDLSFSYEPTAAESIAIALIGTDTVSKLVAERCQTLGITNIRVIKRVARIVAELQPLLADFDPEVFRSAASSVILFGWANDQPEDAPSIDFLRTKTQDVFGLKKREEMPEREAAWSALLDAYGYTWTDELDLELLRSVQAGYFDPDALKKKASAANDRIVAAKADGSFESAWRKYHDSFANNPDEVLDGIYTSFMQNTKYISPTNVSGTVTLFKELGRPEQAKEMLQHYMATRDEPRAFFDLDDDPFGGHVTDPDVRSAFKQKFDSLEEKRDIKAMLLNLKDSWNDETLSILSTLPVDEYVKVLKSSEGLEFRNILSGALQFDRISNATEPMREISARARKALKLIGEESPINRRRVQRFGITFDDPPAGT